MDNGALNDQVPDLNDDWDEDMGDVEHLGQVILQRDPHDDAVSDSREEDFNDLPSM